jgi:hypothetical protein
VNRQAVGTAGAEAAIQGRPLALPRRGRSPSAGSGAHRFSRPGAFRVVVRLVRHEGHFEGQSIARLASAGFKCVTCASVAPPDHRETGSAEAQAWFNRGLLWCYCFNHEEALRCFGRAAAADGLLGSGLCDRAELQQGLGGVRAAGVITRSGAPTWRWPGRRVASANRPVASWGSFSGRSDLPQPSPRL